MKQPPRITIITPSLNQGSYIEETILSVITQNYPNLEYIIMDGGSTDQTLEIIKKHESRISYWESEMDKGQAHAINKGLKRATGEIVNWLNSDDLLEEGALFSLAELFSERPDCFCMYGQIIEFDQKGLKPFQHFPQDKLPLRYYYDFPFAQPAFFFRKECLDHTDYLDEEFEFTMDLDLYYRLMGHYSFVQVDHVLARFRWHPGSKSSRLGELAALEKNYAFASLLNSIGFEKGIELLTDIGLGPSKLKKYDLRRKEAFEMRYEMLFEYLLPYINNFYLKHDYLKIKTILKFYKRHRPEFLSDPRIARKQLMLKLPLRLLSSLNSIRNFAHRIHYPGISA